MSRAEPAPGLGLYRAVVLTLFLLRRIEAQAVAGEWGFAIYLASKDGYQDAMLSNGYPVDE